MNLKKCHEICMCDVVVAKVRMGGASTISVMPFAVIHNAFLYK
jgi:hypothetical protein